VLAVLTPEKNDERYGNEKKNMNDMAGLFIHGR